jgi:hypothetical protein
MESVRPGTSRRCATAPLERAESRCNGQMMGLRWQFQLRGRLRHLPDMHRSAERLASGRFWSRRSGGPMRRATPLILLLLPCCWGRWSRRSERPTRHAGLLAMSWLRPAGRPLWPPRGEPPHSSRVQVAAAAAPAVQTAPAQVLSVQQISRQNVPPQPGSQPDTQAEPDIAVDPNDPSVVVAVFQQGRFADGGSVDPGFAWSMTAGVPGATAPCPTSPPPSAGSSPEPLTRWSPSAPTTPSMSRPLGSTSRTAAARWSCSAPMTVAAASATRSRSRTRPTAMCSTTRTGSPSTPSPRAPLRPQLFGLDPGQLGRWARRAALFGRPGPDLNIVLGLVQLACVLICLNSLTR